MKQAWIVLPLMGCGVIDELQDSVNDLTNPFVAQTLVIGVQPPSAPELTPLAQDGVLDLTNRVEVFLADGTALDNLEEAGIETADVTFSVAGTEVELAHRGDGRYSSGDGQVVPYTDDAMWQMNASVGDLEGTYSGMLPPSVAVDIPDDLAPNTALEIDLSGLGINATIVQVFAMNGEVTFAEPAMEDIGVDFLVDLALSDDVVGVIDVPGSAFPDPGVYALAVTGLVRGGEADGLNTIASRALVGKTAFFVVSTFGGAP